MSFSKLVLLALSSVIFTVGCASSKMKERKEQRDKVAQSSKMYCEFINGEVYPDIDVALNIEMAKHCDLEKPFTMTDYKTPSENPGIMYCCNTKANATFGAPASSAAPKKSDKKDDKKDEIID